MHKLIKLAADFAVMIALGILSAGFLCACMLMALWDAVLVGPRRAQ